MIAFRDWLVDQGHNEVFESSSINDLYTFSGSPKDEIGGVLAVCVSLFSQSYIFWFRSPVVKTAYWAGDPEHSYSVAPVSAKEGEQSLQVSPRQSFERWKVTVENQSERWEDSAIQMAKRVRDGIFRKELVYSSVLAKRTNEEFMQLTFAAAHDLQEPLRTQANYLELIEEILEDEGEIDVATYLNEANRANARMRDLIKDLLNYASLSAKSKREVVSLQTLMDELMADLASVIRLADAKITYSDLPSLSADRAKIGQLVLNLLTNALKYVAPNVPPEISVYVKQEGVFWLLCVEDNGIGIDPVYHKRIFNMFTRLHGRSEYEGTGIGLANCKKVAESMDASIGVDSALNSGSIFWLKIHQSHIIN